jgi:hypothetical protein
MTNIKTKIAIIVGSVFLASCNNGNGKHDIFGLYPGMTRAEVQALAESHKWKCERLTEDADECDTLDGSMRVFYAKNLKESPVTELSLRIIKLGRISNIPADQMVSEISSQYGKKPDNVMMDPRSDTVFAQASWNLSGGNVLTLQGQAAMILKNEELASQDAQAARANLIRNNPAPKF